MSLVEGDFSQARSNAPTPLPQSLRASAPLPRATARKRVVMSESMAMMATDHHSGTMDGPKMKFLLNGKLFEMHRIDLRSRVGAREDWEIVNDADVDHPFHVHGTQFAVLERVLGGHKRTEPFRAWYDTFNLRPQETVRIRIM